jgi:hypothetical protein
MPIQTACPSCQTMLGAPTEYVGREVKCSKCGTQFVVRDESASVPTPPPLPPGAPPLLPDCPMAPIDTSPQQNAPRRSVKHLPQIDKLEATIWQVVEALLGIVVGCVCGYYAAHHFPFWGGIVMMGAPYSPARSSLVPGHMLLCSLILGGIGFILPRYFIWFLSGLLILIGLALAFQVIGKIPAVRNTVDAATKAPSEIAKERASGYAAELFSVTIPPLVTLQNGQSLPMAHFPHAIQVCV